jgi:hypothetical protein
MKEECIFFKLKNKDINSFQLTNCSDKNNTLQVIIYKKKLSKKKLEKNRGII